MTLLMAARSVRGTPRNRSITSILQALPSTSRPGNLNQSIEPSLYCISGLIECLPPRRESDDIDLPTANEHMHCMHRLHTNYKLLRREALEMSNSGLNRVTTYCHLMYSLILNASVEHSFKVYFFIAVTSSKDNNCCRADVENLIWRCISQARAS